MKKLTSILCALLILATVLAGCAPADSTTSTSSQSGGSTVTQQPTSKEPKTVTVWHSFTQENRAALFEEMTKKYSAANSNVNFEIEIYPWATFDTKWKTGLSANALPDLSTALPEGVAMMAKSNVLSPLNDMIEQMGNPFVEKPISILTVDGNVMAVPYYMHARALWYRTDILEKNNLEAPVTMDDLLKVTKAITDSGDSYGMVVPMGKQDFFGTIYLYIFSKSLGGHMITEEGKADLTSPEMLEAIRYVAELYKSASPEGSLNYGDSEHADSFIQGKVAFFFESGFTINRIFSSNPDIAEDFAALRPPVAKEGGVPGWFADYVNFVVWKGDTEDVSKDFLKTMYNLDDYIKFLHLVPGGMLPSIKGVAESEAFLDNEVIAAHKDDIAIIAEGVAGGCPLGADYGLVPAMNIIKTQGIVEEMLQQVVMGTASVEDAAASAEARLNAEIEKLQNS